MKSRRSGMSLVIAGVFGIGFFLVTDPRHGTIAPSVSNLIDAANEARMGTAVGVVGSVVMLILGLWLLTRRTV